MYRKTTISDQLLEGADPAGSSVTKHGLLTKQSKVSETAATTKAISSTKTLDQSQVAIGSRQSKVPVSKSRFGPDYSEILTTDKLYYSSTAIGASEHDLVDGTEVLGMVYRM